MRQPLEGNVYFLKAEESDLIKIGKTSGAVKDRKRGIQSMSPVHLYTIGILKCPNHHEFEKELHTLFAPYREYGEWFRFGRKQRAALKKCFRVHKNGGRFDVETFKEFWKREIARDDWFL